VASGKLLSVEKSYVMQSYNQATVVPIIVPDLGLGETPVILSLWLVPQGSNVLEGDRVVELATNPATVDLLAPVAGQCVRQFVDEDTLVFPGMVIAEILPEDGNK
jgi:pyruvate/2-oxoglutarate dehydrogenase complex dihydrolipoamide acyltransferase (E2) component